MFFFVKKKCLGQQDAKLRLGEENIQRPFWTYWQILSIFFKSILQFFYSCCVAVVFESSAVCSDREPYP